MKKMPKPYKYIDFPPLTNEQKKELEDLAAMKEKDIDTSDIPENDFKNGQFYYAQSLKMQKTKISTNIDADLIKWLKSAGKGYQTRLNNVLRWARMNNCPITQI